MLFVIVDRFFAPSWYKLLNKDEKADKERGEIDVSLQFYSQNNTTGSVLDLATKKKHLSLKDIKHSLGKNQQNCLSNEKVLFFGWSHQMSRLYRCNQKISELVLIELKFFSRESLSLVRSI